MEYGLQMYSLRDITGEDLKGALEKVSKIGYKGVEFAGFFGHSAEEVKSWLDEYGLTVTGTHTGWKRPWLTTRPSATRTSSFPAPT